MTPHPTGNPPTDKCAAIYRPRVFVESVVVSGKNRHFRFGRQKYFRLPHEGFLEKKVSFNQTMHIYSKYKIYTSQTFVSLMLQNIISDLVVKKESFVQIDNPEIRD